ncbi:hypothetical protein EUX98_g6736 [Antrodiella citrinella]|uniref:DNA-directed RNA polymerase n=1 Tax=Antrodiella citrinella TaxID=2447956 RepID=A0A4S4MNI8_9APHY|nr:hypothetical protein EUX98_g6736 [Antrodiella citrinella]
MIPLTRNGVRRNAASIISVSRQGLPRPARLYSSPTKNVQAQVATAGQPSVSAYPPFLPPSGLDHAMSESYGDMESFLKRRMPYALVPTPLPSDRSSSLNDFYFTDSPTQDQISVIDACLHGFHDKAVALDVGTYNAFLDAYLEMATTRDAGKRMYWVEDVCALYEEMEQGQATVTPNPHTYATMLRMYLRFNSETGSVISSAASLPTPDELLSCMVNRQISVSLVVSHRGIQSSEEANEIIKLLSISAVSMNMSKVVNELGLVQVMGSTAQDPLEDVPEAAAVQIKKLPKMNVSRSASGHVTEIRATEPLNTGYEVPFHLENLRKHLAEVLIARRVLSGDAAARQKLLEESVYDIASARLQHEASIFQSLGLDSSRLKDNYLRGWLWEWHQKLQVKLKEEISSLAEKDGMSKASKAAKVLLPFITLLKPETMSILTILEITHMQGSGGLRDGMKTARTLIAIGKAIETEYKTEICKRNKIMVSAQRMGEHGFFSGLGYKNLHARRIAARRFMEDSEEWTSEWTQVMRVKVGSFLVDHLMSVATVTKTAIDKRTGKEVSEEQPAFFHSYEYIRGHKLGVIRLNSLVAERIAKDSIRDTLHPRHLPMLVKPKQWLSDNEGGYLYSKIPVMRYKESVEQLAYLRKASELGHVELVYAGLDVLGSTPWQVNRAIFDVVLKVWNSGIRMPKIPPSVFDMPEPERLPIVDVDQKAKVVYLSRQKAYMNEKANNHSERCNVNYKVEIARTFLGDTFYMPHNLDFRGRAYPIPPHLNHIGDDLSRGLLKFAEGKPLGERGLRWLKIHLANVFGFDKASFDERAQFAMDNLAEIYDSAEKPLDGNQWWTKADDPWQCLATCTELRDALESPVPIEFVSHLPIHQDGTCNGLQHYAALGGDVKGAQQVNLDVTDRPADVYTFVAEMVKERIATDVATGHEMAKLLEGKITRKVVKQTVMTTVYGVTYIGARDQIEKQLKDRGDIPPEVCWESAAYLAKMVLQCIGDIFSGAKNIQTWLNVCARLISKSIPGDRMAEAAAHSSQRIRKEQMTSVIWTTPMGLPIVQPYRQVKRKQVAASLQTVYISDPTVPAMVNSLKQSSAFPPNFIHSLDATHMMLTALECSTRGITFASVHDSYWTHACSVDDMSAVIRDTFIALHTRDILRNLAEEFKERYKSFKIPLSIVRSIKNAEVQQIAENLWDKMREAQDLNVQKSFAEAAKSEAEVLAEEIEEEAEDDVEEDEAAAKKPKKSAKRGRRPTAKASDSTEPRITYFSVADLIPPVPKKGDFDVSQIKKSQYFFS